MSRCRMRGAMVGLGMALLVSSVSAQDSGHAGLTPPRTERGQPLAACTDSNRGEGFVARQSRGNGFRVDSCGRKVSDAGDWLSPQAGRNRQSAVAASAALPLTIDRMTTNSFMGHQASGPIALAGVAASYFLSDGSHWPSGAGFVVLHSAPLDHVEVSGTTFRYVLAPPATGLIYEQSDYDSGDHSAQGTLGPSGPLVIEAEAGSTTAVLRGAALIVSNDATWYGDPLFNFYTAVVGSVVPFEMVYRMQSGTWTADAFTRPFSYTVAGFVDFAHPISTPRAVELSITGPSRVPDELTTRYAATVRYESGALRNATAASSWTVDTTAPASVADGVLTIGTLPTTEADLTLHAAFVQGDDSLVAEKLVTCLADDPAEAPGTWPMFQANARHTGYLATAVEPAALTLQWQRNLGGGLALNPVAAGDGKVFVTLVGYFADVTSLFALRAADGSTLWSKGFGDVFSVNPPSYAYGNVYVQTGNHASDTWLHAFDGETGDTVFKSPHDAQWERYLAPTLFDGKAYVDGGYYGGMYGFDAYTGDELWYAELPQYDEWTPAVNASRAYAYVGDYAPGLYAQDRPTGAPALFVPDPHFDWNGWSMQLAPVLGDHDDLIAIHDGRLISFDTALGTIRWEVQGQFTGQPSLAHDRIYAVDNGRLRVLDELTHTEIWSWQADDGNLVGPMIVTDRHVIVSTDHSVHAVDLTTRQSVWSYPAGGQLAIADNTLYMASANGTLRAFAAPPALSFYTVSPCRLVDTRSGSGAPIGGPSLTSAAARLLHVAGQCGVPETARAVSVNVTATGAAASGYVRLEGTGDPALVFSNINYTAGQTRANNAFATLSPAGDLTALTGQAPGTTVDLIVDVNGYFE